MVCYPRAQSEVEVFLVRLIRWSHGCGFHARILRLCWSVFVRNQPNSYEALHRTARSARGRWA